MHPADFAESQKKKKKKNPGAICYTQRELNPGPLAFVPGMFLSELIPYFLEVSDL